MALALSSYALFSPSSSSFLHFNSSSYFFLLALIFFLFSCLISSIPFNSTADLFSKGCVLVIGAVAGWLSVTSRICVVVFLLLFTSIGIVQVESVLSPCKFLVRVMPDCWSERCSALSCKYTVSSAGGPWANLSAAWMQRLRISSASLMVHVIGGIASFPCDKSVVLVVECCIGLELR